MRRKTCRACGEEKTVRAFYRGKDGRCAICDNKLQGSRNIYIDHDHTSGNIRGLLCQPCNSGIGFMKDSRLTIMRAYLYLIGLGKNPVSLGAVAHPQVGRAAEPPKPITSRVCRGCGAEKPLVEFGKKRSGLYGHRPRCKRCEILATREYEHRKKEAIAKAAWGGGK